MKTLRELATEAIEHREIQDSVAVGDFRTACSPDVILALLDERDALKADAARYRWLRTKSVELSFPNDLIAMLVKDQNELDGSMWAKP